MLAYSSIGQIKYVIIEINIRDSNDKYANMITYMLLYIYKSRNFCLHIEEKLLFFKSYQIYDKHYPSEVGLKS